VALLALSTVCVVSEEVGVPVVEFTSELDSPLVVYASEVLVLESPVGVGGVEEPDAVKYPDVEEVVELPGKEVLVIPLVDEEVNEPPEVRNPPVVVIVLLLKVPFLFENRTLSFA